MHRLLAFAALSVLMMSAVSCGADDPETPVIFKQAEGALSIPGEGIDNLPLLLMPDDTAFFGPASAGEKASGLELSLRSADNLLWLQLQLLDVRNTRRYALDSKTDGRITLLIGETCDGGMGDLSGQACRWHSSDFYQDGCWAALKTISATTVSGQIECRTLGALCPDGSGVQSAAATCSNGQRMETAAFTATFRMVEPLSALEMP
jgi:hypothetical protein